MRAEKLLLFIASLAFFTPNYYIFTIVTAKELPHHLFTIRRSVALQKSPYVVWTGPKTTRKVTTLMTCAKNCGKHPKCMSFYLTKVAAPKNDENVGEKSTQLWTCQLITGMRDLTDLIPGQGVLGYLKKFDRLLKTRPDLTPGTFALITRTPRGLVAFYDCSSANARMTNIGLLFHKDADQWSDMNRACNKGICDQTGLAGTLLSITKIDTTTSYNIRTLCADTEKHHSDARCDGSGQWSVLNTSPAKVGCISPSCFRTNLAARSSYSGTKAVSKNGITCQAWRDTWPNFHMQFPAEFLEDGQSIQAATNYCRDPDNESKPWCYQLTGERWAYCGVPRCRLPV